jgi:hypothetical protein
LVFFLASFFLRNLTSQTPSLCGGWEFGALLAQSFDRFSDLSSSFVAPFAFWLHHLIDTSAKSDSAAHALKTLFIEFDFPGVVFVQFYHHYSP